MKIFDYIKQEKIYGIIRQDNLERVVELVNAYKEGGIKIIELNTPLENLAQVTKIEDILFVQGGIITSAQASVALEFGANAISSPIFQQNLVRLSTCMKAFLIPSVTTPNEAYNAWKAGIPLIKIYPVAAMGATRYIKELIKPMPFLNVLPCGSVKFDDVEKYLKIGATAVGIGRELYKNSYSDTVKKARELVKIAKSF